MHPIVLLIVVIAVLAFVSWYKRAPPGQQKKVAIRVALFGGGALVLVALLTGRLNPIFAALAAAVPLVYRAASLVQAANTFRGFANQFKSARGPTPGKHSQIETRFLRMTLDHDSGAMDGEVLEGEHAGRRLSELTVEQVLALLAHCRAEDSQSAAVLEAYLDRVHGDSWRDGRGSGESGGAGDAMSGPMTPQEAREVLGVGPDATREEIVDAHRRLMQKLHPDRGGSTYLAAKLNEAKKTLVPK